MPRSYSTIYLEELNRTSGSEPLLLVVEINHADLATPARFVNDTQDLVSNGDTYYGAPFRYVLPNNPEQGNSTAQIQVDNVGRDLMAWIELSAGGEGATITLGQVLRSNPDNIEWAVTLDLTNIRADAFTVTADLGFKNLYEQSAIALSYTPAAAPGLY